VVGAASAAIRGNDHRNAVAGAIAGLGAAIAIGAMGWFSLEAHYPLVIIPFATSIVLVIGAPEAEPAQPRAARRIRPGAHRQDGLKPSLRFCSANRSPSRASSTLRWWKASSVER
jgi:hypothetical protein